jgi:hypothetical protein
MQFCIFNMESYKFSWSDWKTLPLDVKMVIASSHVEAFMNLYIMDTEFRHDYLKYKKLIKMPYMGNTYKITTFFGDHYVYQCNTYWKNNHVHRGDGLPAAYYDNGFVEYFRRGQLHRDGDEPAVIGPNGHLEYFKNGLRHRDYNLPAVILVKGAIINGIFLLPRDYYIYFKHGSRVIGPIFTELSTQICCNEESWSNIPELIPV